MATSWFLRTDGDPLAAIRQFLVDLWFYSEVKGMLVQLEPTAQARRSPVLVEDPVQLLEADPFAPLVTCNAARLAAQLASERPTDRFGVILRPCEAEALHQLAQRSAAGISNWLTIGIDCLGSYPAEEFEWRSQRAFSTEQLTRSVLDSARQGGIATYRFRRACQMCGKAASQDMDLNIGLLGLPVREFILLIARDDDIAGQLHLAQLTDGEATPEMLEQHSRVQMKATMRRLRTGERMIGALSPDLPTNARELVAYLTNCLSCQECLNACALYLGELVPGGDISQDLTDEVHHWLAACVACGMCEQACPKHLPLTAIHTRIGQAERLGLGIG